MEKIIRADGEEILFTFEQKCVKRINLRVRRDGSVYVSAPYGIPMVTVEAFVREQREFIRRAQSELSPSSPFCEGCTVFYLGEPYRLCLKKGKRALAFFDGVATLTLPRTPSELEKEYMRTLAEHFLPLIIERCQALEARIPRLRGRAKEIRVRTLKTMWGNCHPKEGRLTFSATLAAMPQEVIDGVVAHEYIHFSVRGHGGEFYRRLTEISPDYKELSRALVRLAREQKKQR